MKDNSFVISNLWTPNQPNDDVLDISLQNNLTKPIIELPILKIQKTRQSQDFEKNMNNKNQMYEQSKNRNNAKEISPQQQTYNINTEENLDPMNNFRSVRVNNFTFNSKLADKSYQQQQQQQQSSTQSKQSSSQYSPEKSNTDKSINNYKSNLSQKRSYFSGIAQDTSISYPHLSASQSFSPSSENYAKLQSPTKTNNNNNNSGVVRRNKSSFLNISKSKMNNGKQRRSSSSSSSSNNSENSSDSEKRDTLPSQIFTLSKDTEQIKKEKTIADVDKDNDDALDSQYDSFTVRMKTFHKLGMNVSAPIGSVKNGGQLKQIKINKDVFSSSSSSSVTQEKLIQNQETEAKQLSHTFGTGQIEKQQQQQQQLQQLQQKQQHGFLDLIKRIKIKNAIFRMANKTSYRRLKLLEEKHLSLIGDLSIQKQSDEKVLKQQQVWYYKLIQHYMRYPTFNPYSIYKMIWDVFMLFVIFFFFLSIPLLLSTGDQFEELFGYFPYFIPSIILIVDACINMNTGYYRNGSLVVAKYMVLRNYARKLLAIDVIGIIPIFLYTIAPSSTLKGFLFLYFIKYKSITKIFKRLELRLDLKSTLLNIIALIKLLFTVLFIAHIFANFWLFLAKLNPEQNWLQKSKFQSDLWYHQYMTAYYYITVTMVTVGYGDITPSNQTEVFFSIVTILLACGVFAYRYTFFICQSNNTTTYSSNSLQFYLLKILELIPNINIKILQLEVYSFFNKLFFLRIMIQQFFQKNFGNQFQYFFSIIIIKRIILNI